MEVDTALLCDAATVREGLLHILGGGITQIVRDKYPADLNLTLALRIMVHPTEAEHQHEVKIRVQGMDGEKIVQVTAQVQAQAPPDNLEPGSMGQLLIPWNFPGRPKLPAPGKYSMELLIDGVHQRSIPFTAALLPQEVD